MGEAAALSTGRGVRRSRRILFLGLNYAPERIGMAIYSTGLCEAMAAAGFDVQVVAAVPYYPEWRVFDGFRAPWPRRTREQGVDVTRVPIYVPRNPTGARRLLHHASFTVAAAPVLLWRAIAQRPDLVVTVAPSLIAAPAAAAVARLFGARSWLHVQDFEVGAAFATGLLRPDNRAARLATGFEARMLRAFDLVSSISAEMCARLVRLGVDPPRVFELRNWADTDKVVPLDRPSKYRERWGITAPQVLLYSGNIANKQGIEVVVEAARLLAHRRDVAFVICGEGPNRARLEALADGLDMVSFHDLQPAAELPELLGLATLHLLPQAAGAADLVLPSKLTNMLASGRPVIALAAGGTGLARELEGCGVVVKPGDPESLAAAIADLIDDPERLALLRVRSREQAVTAWDGRHILADLVGRLRRLLD